MSGRVRVTLSDGRRVTGYRKTLATRTKVKPLHLLPDWRLAIELPPMYSFTLPVGPYQPVLGVHINPRGHAVITGKNRSWVESRARTFVRLIAPYGLPSPIPVVLERGDEPASTTLSGPGRTKGCWAGSLTSNGGEVRLIIGSSSRCLASDAGASL